MRTVVMVNKIMPTGSILLTYKAPQHTMRIVFNADSASRDLSMGCGDVAFPPPVWEAEKTRFGRVSPPPLQCHVARRGRLSLRLTCGLTEFRKRGRSISP
jgi:hypothetical protein